MRPWLGTMRDVRAGLATFRLAVTIVREKGIDTNEQDHAERHGAIMASVSYTSVFAVPPS